MIEYYTSGSINLIYNLNEFGLWSNNYFVNCIILFSLFMLIIFVFLFPFYLIKKCKEW